METTSINKDYLEGEIIRAFGDDIEKTRTVRFTISTSAKDRHGTVLNMEGWQLDNFNRNPIVGYQHNVYGDNMCSAPNPDDVIAKANAWMDTYKGSRVLMSKATFEPADLNPMAEKVFRKIIFGSLNSSSTGVLPNGPLKKEYVKNDQGDITDYTINFPGQTLVEWSVVNIPADPEALKRSLKSHTFSALSFIQRYVPELSMNDLKGMKVQDILDMVEKRQSGADLDPEKLEKALSKGPDPDLVNMKEYLNKIKK